MDLDRSAISMFCLLQLGIFLVAASSEASGRVGNGGNVVICGAGSGRAKAVQLLDYYEAEIRGIQIDLGAPGLSVEQKISLALDRLAKVSPRRARRYREWATSFESESRFMPNTTLVNLDDSLNIIVPNGCEISQIVVQREPRVEEDRRYTISNDLWQRLDNDDKAGVILHEIIYREAIQLFGQNDSFNARYFNSYISSHRIEDFTPRSFIHFLVNRGFFETEIQGVDLALKEGALPEFHENGMLKSAQVIEASPAMINGYSLKVSKTVEFYPNGNAKSVGISDFALIELGNQKVKILGLLKFHENGRIQELDLSDDFSNSYAWRGETLSVKSSIRFYETGIPFQFHLSKPGLFRVHENTLLLLGAVELYPDGEVKQADHLGPTDTPQRFKTPFYEGNLVYWIGPYAFFPNGLLKSCSPYSDSSCLTDATMVVDGKKVRGGPSFFSDDGFISRGYLNEEYSFQVRGHTIPCLGEFKRSSNGGLEVCTLSRDANVDIQGMEVEFKGGTTLAFSPNGAVTLGTLASSRLFGQDLPCNDREKHSFGGDVSVELDGDERVVLAYHLEKEMDWSYLPFRWGMARTVKRYDYDGRGNP